VVYVYTTEYYSTIKKSEILPFQGKWVELENIMLSEVNQFQKDKSFMFCLIWGKYVQVQIQALSSIPKHIDPFFNSGTTRGG
jgi:hypothetical protein